MDLKARLFDSIDRLQPTYRELLRDLVREPSTLGNERRAQLRLFRALRRQGLEPRLYELNLARLGRHPAFAPTDVPYAGRPNLVATLQGTGGGRSLVLNGHIDVVSAEPEHWWTYAPWSGTLDGNRLYGRGAYDMKGGLVAAMLALQARREMVPRPRGSIIFESVIEEECTGNGTLAARLDGPRVDAALIAEPTDLHVWLATLGVIWFELTVIGRPAYVGQAGMYVNAIEKACELVVELRKLPIELNASFEHPLFPSGARPLTLNIGRITGSDWASNVPLECSVTGRMSFPIDRSVERAQCLLEERVAHAASKAGLNMLTRVLALEWAAFGITVNAVAPTFVETEFGRQTLADPELRRYWTGRIPLGRVATVEDVSAAVVYFASPAAEFVTGTVLPVDGGLTMR